MKMSALFNRTLREAPAEADSISYQLLARAGYVQSFGAGIFAYLPLGQRAVENLSRYILEQMHAQDLPVVDLPFIRPTESRLLAAFSETRFEDHQGRALSLSENSEIAAMLLAQNHIRSYRQLPAFFTGRGQNWHDEAHPSNGLLHAHIDEMLELFSFFASQDELEGLAQQLSHNLESIFSTHRIPVSQVEGQESRLRSAFKREWHYETPQGRDEFFRCPECGYAASTGAVQFRRRAPWEEPPGPLKMVATPYCATIEALASYLEVPKERTAKMVFLVASSNEMDPPEDQRLIFAVVPGDRELDERRLALLLDASDLRPATEEEIRNAGAVPGYGSPIGIAEAYVVVDVQIPLTANMVTGANQEGYHLINVNFDRDFVAQKVAEISKPRQGDACPMCSFPMEKISSIRLANSSAPDLRHTFLDANASPTQLHALLCTVSLSRTLACMVEENHDDFGIVWPPINSAPFFVHLVLIGEKDSQAGEAADEIVEQLREQGFEPLYDERPERAGVKFMDADLIGIPLRITVSQRTLSQNAVEFKQRFAREARLVDLEAIGQEIEKIYTQDSHDHPDMIP